MTDPTDAGVTEQPWKITNAYDRGEGGWQYDGDGVYSRPLTRWQRAGMLSNRSRRHRLWLWLTGWLP